MLYNNLISMYYFVSVSNFTQIGSDVGKRALKEHSASHHLGSNPTQVGTCVRILAVCLPRSAVFSGFCTIPELTALI